MQAEFFNRIIACIYKLNNKYKNNCIPLDSPNMRVRLIACHDLEVHGICKVFAYNYNYDSTPALAHAIYILQSTINWALQLCFYL